MPPSPRHSAELYCGVVFDAAKPGVEGRNRGWHVAARVMKRGAQRWSSAGWKGETQGPGL